MSKKNQMNQANDPVNSIVGLDLFADWVELADLVELSEQDLHQVSGGEVSLNDISLSADVGFDLPASDPFSVKITVDKPF